MNYKMIIKSICACVVCFIIAGCSSQSVSKANFYLLNEASQIADNKTLETSENSEVSQYITLSKVKLSNYLKQPNIAMQLDNHQLHYSNNHLWAETLQSGIANSLLTDLNRGSSNLQFVSYNSPVVSQANAKLTVEIEHFITTNKSEVILSGQFWLFSNTKNDENVSKNIKRNFSYSLSLEHDGYPHSVSKMRQLLTLLSEEIDATGKTLFSQ